MNNSLLDDFKGAWQKPNNALPQIIIINIVIFLILAVLNVFGRVSGLDFISNFIYDQFTIPPTFNDFVLRPWTLITYAFSHSLRGIMHILFNMLMLYWFGRLIVEYLGNQKLINLYILGALAGAAIYLLVYNLIPYYIEQSSSTGGMVGASAAVYAIAVAAATLLPNYSFHLVFIGPVKIKYIAAIGILVSFLGTVGSNAGGNLAHLGGAFMGYVYIKQLQSGNDWGSWIAGVMTFFKSFFIKQSKIKVSHKKSKAQRKASNASTNTNTSSTAANMYNQAEIDTILDKISQSGYESLSKEEKQKLFNASKKG